MSKSNEEAGCMITAAVALCALPIIILVGIINTGPPKATQKNIAPVTTATDHDDDSDDGLCQCPRCATNPLKQLDPRTQLDPTHDLDPFGMFDNSDDGW